MIEKALSEQLPYVPSREQIRWCYRDFIGFRIKYWGSFDDYFKSQMYRKSDLTRKEWDIVKDIHGNYCVIEGNKDAGADLMESQILSGLLPDYEAVLNADEAFKYYLIH